MTGANLLLDRLLLDYYPEIFGTSEEPLDIEASRMAFERLATDVNKQYGEEGRKEMSLDGNNYGFINVANETVCRLAIYTSDGSKRVFDGHSCVRCIS